VAISAFAEAERTDTAAVLALASMSLTSGEMARGAAETDPATTRKRPRAWEASILGRDGEKRGSKGRREDGREEGGDRWWLEGEGRDKAIRLFDQRFGRFGRLHHLIRREAG